MGGQARDMSLWVFLLVISTPLGSLVGCGWVEHNARSAFRVVNGFGTLLVPEETSCRWVGCFFWPLSALAV